MNGFEHLVQTIALTMGVAWASGINLYAAILTLGILGGSGYLDLPPGLEIVTDPIILTAAGLMFIVEFFADKIPGIDTGWDAIQTFIRIPAGAVLAAAAVGDIHPALTVAVGILGAGVSGATHATKAGTRVVLNTSPEPFSNWAASISEDLAVVAGVWTALKHPWLFILAFVVFIVFSIWLLPRLWRGVKSVVGSLVGLLRRQETAEDPAGSG